MSHRQMIFRKMFFFVLFLFVVSPPSFANFSNTNPSITLHDNHFHPKRMTISPGQTITWTNEGKESHTITSSKKIFSSGAIYPGGKFKYTFVYPGTYRYHCTDHIFGGIFGMRGVIIVK
jgi:plastocyanin